MTTSIKILLLLTITFTFSHVVKSDTKLLRDINIRIPNSNRLETISLENDQDLVVKGVIIENYPIPDDAGHVLKATIDYVSDKNGYRAKYTLTKEEYVMILRLNPSTFKSLTG